MVSLVKRMRKLKARLLQVRVGLGATIFPSASSNISPLARLHLSYAQKSQGSHLGARKFWRQCLPRLKYYNPGLKITVTQTKDEAVPPLLTLYFAKPSDGSISNPSSPESKVVDNLAPPPMESESVQTLDIRDLDYSQIWERVKSATSAEDMKPSEEDTQEVEELERNKVQAKIDKERVSKARRARKDQLKMLAAAQAEIAKQKQEQ
ncbi:hypothetical protein FQN57_004487 [Myotisia sp. PD_48]|nr:hypothetical protein FQN57_004487 [Myotisia sp. PD_48]